MSFLLLLALLSATFLSLCNGAIHQSFDNLSPKSSFDFVIIGGGTAGSVIASRLTEDPQFKVLLIEAGPSNQGILDSEIPLLLNEIPPTFSWNYSTTPQVSAGGRVVAYPRGYLLGGSSSVNAMYYTRGSSSDFDRFANFTGDPGWSWTNIFPYFLKNEKWVPPADDHNTNGQFNPAFHNLKGTGMNTVSLPGFTQEIDGRVLQTSKDLASEFPFTLDYNNGTPLGLGYLQSTIGNGTRSSSAIAYLTPSVQARPNLQIVLNTRVTRVLQTNPIGGSKSFRQVELSTGSKLVTVTALKEVILSAGSINTPHVLLNSGIGDKDELTKLGISPTFDLPSVGKNLSDHPGLGVSYFVNADDTLDSIFGNATLESELIDEWETNRTGPMVTIGVNHIVLLRIPDNSSIFKTFSDPSSGQKSPHFEISISNGAVFAALAGHFVTALIVHLTPASRGSVSLQSNNPFDPPLINPGFLTSQFDVQTLKEEVTVVKRFFSAPAWKGYVLQPQGTFANTTTDQALEEFVINNAGTSAHPVGTASMSPKNANFGVVDPDLKVKGVQGLRIVDASVMPFVPAAHPQAATYVIAERAADLIKAEWQ
ncbi:aryl-alcohol oxidase [Gymnopilus junonius]|uniref:pyranose dehydrogenase (acceptor) n=1 Tax=Gymnopilus junonius TaxID=109634 RepID=A0A9P5NEW4_GYMJU|nr:aryl-alcohol oxidase [Gymnopilus junonius]